MYLTGSKYVAVRFSPHGNLLLNIVLSVFLKVFLTLNRKIHNCYMHTVKGELARKSYYKKITQECSKSKDDNL